MYEENSSEKNNISNKKITISKEKFVYVKRIWKSNKKFFNLMSKMGLKSKNGYTLFF